jgi:hypothetical protein
MEPKKGSTNHYVPETWSDGPGIRIVACEPGGRLDQGAALRHRTRQRPLTSSLQSTELEENGFKGKYVHS